MSLYCFNIEKKEVIKHFESTKRTSVSYELGDMLLSFINADFSEYNLLLSKAEKFYDEYNQILDSEELCSYENLGIYEREKIISNAFCDFNDSFCTQKTWRYALEQYLQKFCHAEIFPCYKTKKNEEYNIINRCNCTNLQNELLKYTELIFDYDYRDDEYQQLAPIVRFALYYPNFTMPLTEHIEIYPDINVHLEAFSIFETPFNDEYITKDELIEQIKYANENTSFLSGYHFESLKDLLFCEMLKMAQAGIMLRKCKNCGKYFIYKPTQPAKYCKNIVPGKTITCQQEGAQKEYIKAMNPISDIYMKAIRRMSNRLPSKASGLRTPEADTEYKKWKQEQSDIMKAYKEKYQNANSSTEKKQICQDYKNHIESVLSKK